MSLLIMCMQAEYDGCCITAPLGGDLKDHSKGDPFNG